MRPTMIATLVLAVVLGVVLWLAIPTVAGRPLNFWEACLVSAAVLVIFKWRQGRRLRRQRRHLESLRDSALW